MEGPREELFDFLIVVDFEGTCEEEEDSMPRHEKNARREVIEFPAVAVKFGDVGEEKLKKHTSACIEPGKTVCSCPVVVSETFVFFFQRNFFFTLPGKGIPSVRASDRWSCE